MSLICIERHDGKLQIVAYEYPSATTCIPLATLHSELTAEIFKEFYARSMLMARQVGASGIG